MNRVQSFYGRWAPVYDRIARLTPGIGRVRRRAADALDVAPDDTVVEMGAGTGANTRDVARRLGPDGGFLGIDVARPAIARARKRALRSGQRRVGFVLGDAARLPIRSADALLATFVVGMFEEPSAVVDGWCDTIEPGGRIVLLDATRSEHPVGSLLNPLFDVFVRVTTPPGPRLRYPTAPAATLDRRVAAARESLADRGEIVVDETHALGFLRLTAARISS